MKHLLIGMMLCIAALGAKAESLYDACENIPGISTTYVSKVLLGAAQNQVYMYPQGMNLNHIVGKLDGIQVLEGEKKAATALRDKARPILDKGGYDLLLRNRDEGEVSEMLSLAGVSEPLIPPHRPIYNSSLLTAIYRFASLQSDGCPMQVKSAVCTYVLPLSFKPENLRN